MGIGTYRQAIFYLESFIGRVIFKVDKEYLKHHDPLERMRVLLDLLGNPQEKFKSVLIGGTSGKGSTAYLISHILTTAGYKTGFTISPHLEKINERLQIDGEPISDGKFTKMIDSIVDTIELMKKTKVGSPSYFEILIAMAFLYFVQQKVDIAVVEVGMGGEFDATNTLYPLVAVLTNVSLDHTNVLGGTVQKIASTKAGIIKGSPRPLNASFFAQGPATPFPSTPVKQANSAFGLRSASASALPAPFDGVGSPSSRVTPRLVVVTGAKQPSVIKIIEDRCKKVGAELYRLHKDFDFKIRKESLEGSVFDVTIINGREQKLHDLGLSLLGRYQVENASLAIVAVMQLEKFGFRVGEGNIRNALKTAFFPGRFEVIAIARESIALRSLRQFGDSSNPNVNQRSSLARAKFSKTGSNDALFKSSPHAKAPRAIFTPRSRTADSQLSTLNSQLVLDGAHNPTKMKAFLSTLKKLYPKQKKIFVVGFKFDKDVKKMLKQVLQVADIVILTEFKAKTDVSTNVSMKISNVKSQMSNLISNLKYRKDVKIITSKNSKIALDKALSLLAIQQFNNPAIIVVTGSLYLIGEIRNML